MKSYKMVHCRNIECSTRISSHSWSAVEGRGYCGRCTRERNRQGELFR